MPKMIDRLRPIAEDLHFMAIETRPMSDRDPNFRLNSAIEVARDQVNYAIRILSNREPDPRQQSLLDVVQGMAEWCTNCDNPKGGCTCPKQN